MHVAKDDTVVVLSGKYRGKMGRVLRVLPKKSRIIVEHVNVVKRHTRPNPAKGVQGGVVEKEAPIHVSNVMVVDPSSGKPTRVGHKRLADGKKVRIARRSGEMIGKEK
ncbi:MAG: 50S ribosomal protein L24 [Candidatus Latescibacterota bacterium]|jgi:large subunit ribosomal protein L24|nr:MAG: 50S ribosomal protein L24 [Candidatus Latescibacterota bacterium]